MTTYHFSYKELLKKGWEKTKQHFGFLAAVMLAYLVLTTIAGQIPIVGNVVGMLMTIVIIYLSLHVIGGATPKFDDLLKPFKNYKITWHYFLATLLYFIIVIVGLIALILPGIWLAVRLYFYGYLIIENENLNPVDALKKSFHMTDNKFWILFGWGLTVAIINFIGLLALGIGLLFTMPVTLLACAYLYRSVHAHHMPAHASTETISHSAV